MRRHVEVEVEESVTNMLSRAKTFVDCEVTCAILISTFVNEGVVYSPSWTSNGSAFCLLATEQKAVWGGSSDSCQRDGEDDRVGDELHCVR